MPFLCVIYLCHARFIVLTLFFLYAWFSVFLWRSLSVSPYCRYPEEHYFQTIKNVDEIPIPFRTFYVVQNSSFSVDTRQRKNDFWNFSVSYSTSENLRLGRWKVQVRIFKSSDLRIDYKLTWEFQKRDTRFLNTLCKEYQWVILFLAKNRHRKFRHTANCPLFHLFDITRRCTPMLLSLLKMCQIITLITKNVKLKCQYD